MPAAVRDLWNDTRLGSGPDRRAAPGHLGRRRPEREPSAMGRRQRPQPPRSKTMKTIPRNVLLAVAGTAALLAGCASTTKPGSPSPQPVVGDQRPAELTPRRAPSKTMEVWIAAWEDGRGDLHAPSTVYVEVDPTRWTYGDGSVSPRYTVLRPLQVEERAPPMDTRGTEAMAPAARPPAVPPATRRGA
ncbi:TraV family lipoprotein [uncultured Lamprocystis sp.]|uniref:TraV family lipoprotein n=1 Tax=uncultured Lamprocystis sp. TaxID=543132 RepID=UPI0025E1A917|nr:TraV family lipoprotein [uncultured Lamprocystis sp.]